jgi:hypothetical protein
MSRTLVVMAGVVAFLSVPNATSAFTTQPVDPATMSNRLADPDELAEKMSNGQSGGTIFGLPAGPRLQFFDPPLEGNGFELLVYSARVKNGDCSHGGDAAPRGERRNLSRIVSLVEMLQRWVVGDLRDHWLYVPASRATTGAKTSR